MLIKCIKLVFATSMSRCTYAHNNGRCCILFS